MKFRFVTTLVIVVFTLVNIVRPLRAAEHHDVPIRSGHSEISASASLASRLHQFVGGLPATIPLLGPHRRSFDSPPVESSTFGIPPESVCSSDSSCAGYPLAFCDGTCKCREGALNAGSACIASESGLSDSASCPTGQSYVTELGTCLAEAGPGSPCQYSQQCGAVEPGSFCRQLTCQCPYGMRRSEQNRSCTPIDRNCTRRGQIWISEVGECREVVLPGASPCSHSMQCSAVVAEAHCLVGRCTCPNESPVPIDGTCGLNCSRGFIYSSVAGSCLPTVQPGDQCMYSIQCHAVHPGMVCNLSRCRCPRDEVFSGSRCTRNCPRSYRRTPMGICRPGCRSNQIENSGSCVDIVAPDQPCVVNRQCTGGSQCLSGKCTCPSYMFNNNGVCLLRRSSPLQNCTMNEQCIGGSTCTNGRCSCPPGTTVLNGQCITPMTVPPGSSCNSAVYCGGSSTCQMGVCTCIIPLRPLNGTCQYPPAVPPGGACPTGGERCLGGSQCQRGICSCPLGTVPEGSECAVIERADPGQPCSTSRLCQGQSYCVQGVCACVANFVQERNQCVPPRNALAGQSCANGQSCGENAYCSQAKICTCISPTVSVNGVCKNAAIALPNESCQNGEVCTNGANCVSGICVCPPNQALSGGVCRELTGTLGPCTDNSQCVGGSFCDLTQQACVCAVGQMPVGGVCVELFARRWKRSSFGQRERCLTNEGCRGRCEGALRCRCELVAGDYGGYCVAGTPQYAPTHDLSLRSPDFQSGGVIGVGPGTVCSTSNVQCVNGSECRNDVCMCPSGSVALHGACQMHRTAAPGESCSYAEKCESAESFCDPHTWRCECRDETMLAIGHRCVPRLRSPPGFPCDNGEICSGKSVCERTTGKCVCPQELIHREKKCIERLHVGPGDSCSTGHEICSRASVCDPTTGRCVCPSSHVQTQTSCRRVISVELGGWCNGAEQTCTGNALCQNGRCTCPSGHRTHGRLCLPIVRRQPGESCIVEEDQCEGGSSCQNGKCLCSIGFFLHDGHCSASLAVLPNESCDAIGRRCTRGSKCVGGRCRCPSGQTYQNEHCRKLPAARLGESCADGQGCASPHSKCSTWLKCECVGEFAQVGGECVRRPAFVLPPGQCDSVSRLCVGGSRCVDGRCVCLSGQTFRDGVCKSLPLVAPGSSCIDTGRCVEHAKCSSRGVCECESGRISTGSECRLKSREVYPGGSCSTRDLCLGGSSCSSGICICPSSRPDFRNRECSPEAEVSANHSIKSALFRSNDFAVLPLNQQSNSMPPASGMLGEFCDGLGADCAIENAVCARHVCQCSEQFVQAGPLCIQRLKIANRVVNPGGACSSGTFCDGGSTCSSNKICQCPDGTFAYGRLCINGDVFLPREGGQETDGPWRRKIVKKSPGTPCRENPDICTGGSYCYNGYCVCPTGYEERDGGCHVPRILAEPGQSCDRPLSSIAVVECTGNSVCANGFCVCPNGEPIQNHVCVTVNTIAQPGEPCILNVTKCLGTSFCSPEAGICCCPQRQVFLNGQCAQVTVVSPSPLQSCTPTSICQGNSYCQNGICQCLPGTVFSQTRNVCQPIVLGTPMRINVSPGQACGSGVGCAQGAQCLSGICVCVNGQQIYNGRCVPKDINGQRPPVIGGLNAAPGDSCLTPGTICTGGSRCVQGFCACDPGYQAIDGQCTSIQPPQSGGSNELLPGETCDPRCEYTANCLQRCSGGSICVDGICTCPQGQQPLDGICVPLSVAPPPNVIVPAAPQSSRKTARPSEPCDFSVTCLGGSSCVLGICQCPRGFSPSLDLTSCVNNLLAEPAGALPLVASRGRLLMHAFRDYEHLGRKCNHSTDCDRGASCLFGVCACPPHTIANQSEHCVSEEQPPGLLDRPPVATSAFLTPIPTAERVKSTSQFSFPGSPCGSDVVCQMGAVCRPVHPDVHFCVCDRRLVTNATGHCTTKLLANTKKKLPGAQCSKLEKNCAEGSTCTYGYCLCPEEFANDGQGKCVLNRTLPSTSKRQKENQEAGNQPLHGYCISSEDCRRPALCLDRKCKCPEGTTESPDNKCVYKKITVKPGAWCNSDLGILCPTGACCLRNVCVCEFGIDEKNGDCRSHSYATTNNSD